MLVRLLGAQDAADLQGICYAVRVVCIINRSAEL